MRQTIFCFLFFLLMCTSCTTVYYVGETTEATTLYAAPNAQGGIVSVIPARSKVLTREKNRRYHYIIFETHKGYAYQPVYTGYHKFNCTIDGYLYGYASSNKGIGSSAGSSGGNSAGSNSTKSSGGTVQVQGYTRKDGTYVRPHTRSAPARRH